MIASRYAALCAVLCGLANFLLWCGFEANVFISEPLLHSVNARAPERIGAHDGYYGMALTNFFYMVSNLVVPIMTNYVRCKWILTLSGVCFLLYFLSFLLLNRILFFGAASFLGFGFSAFNVGYSGYLTEFSTRATIEKNTALSWGVSSLSVMGGAFVNLAVTTINLKESSGIASNYREYSDTEIRCFFAAFSCLSCLAIALFASLPNKHVEGNIAESNVRHDTVTKQLKVMLSILVHHRVLILVPYYLYIGLFFSLWTSIVPTTFQFTKALSLNVYIPAYFGIMFTIGCVSMSLLTMKLSTLVRDFSLKPLMVITVCLHLLIYAIIICVIPEWSTVRPNDEPSLLVQPTVLPILLLAFMFGVADAANNSTRTVISSLLLPTTRQQTFGASRFYHGLAAGLLLFVAPSLSIYAYVAILTTFLAVSTIAFFHSCNFIRDEECNAAKRLTEIDLRVTEKGAVDNAAFTTDS